jgi:hypothetical protein
MMFSASHYSSENPCYGKGDVKNKIKNRKCRLQHQPNTGPEWDVVQGPLHVGIPWVHPPFDIIPHERPATFRIDIVELLTLVTTTRADEWIYRVPWHQQSIISLIQLPQLAVFGMGMILVIHPVPI